MKFKVAANVIKSEMAKRNGNVTDIARAIGITGQTLFRILEGYPCRFDTYVKLCKFFKLKTDFKID